MSEATGARPALRPSREPTDEFVTESNGPTDEYGLCVVCGGHGAVIQGDRMNAHGRNVPNVVPCPHCDQRDRVTPMMEARADG